MGMAASQARFLGLTARKSNTEYEGQQINQQRTTLSNQSANYYNSLLGMTVPTPPSVEDYTTTTYTFSDGALDNTVTTIIAQSNGTFLVSYTSSWTDDNAVVSASSSIVTRTASSDESEDETYTYRVGSKVLRTLGELDDDYNIDNDEYLSSLSDSELEDLLEEESYYLALLNEKYGTTEGDWMVIYKQDSTTGSWVPTFYKTSDLESTIYSSTGSSQSYISCYTVGSATETSEVKGQTAYLEQDSSGRYINITLVDDDGTEVTYSLTTNTTTDQDAYDDAMNQYEYDEALYEQSIEEINAKIEVIQAEDQTLELRLKQLDTEQEAIQTEIDAVEKVIEKNTESTFKTFS